MPRLIHPYLSFIVELLVGIALLGTAQAETYDFKFASGAQNIPALKDAGQYIRVEVTPNSLTPANDVLFRFTSSIPQPVSRIGYFNFDLGQHSGLFSSVSIFEQIGTNVVTLSNVGHPYLPNFTPDFRFGVFDPILYDTRMLSPGESLTLSALLGSGQSFANVIAAMNQGIDPNATIAGNGLRLGVLAYNLLGVRPDPRKTLMDDAGFITAHLLAVPEPGTWAMSLVGLVGVSLLVRRRRACR